MYCSLLVACLTLSVDAGCSGAQCGGAAPQLQRFQRTETHMGTSFGIVLYAADEKTANRAFEAAFARIAELDRICSDYDPESELNKLAARAPTIEPVSVSDDLYEILRRSRDLSERTGGAFDITIGPITKLWRRARRLNTPPDPERLSELLKSVGYENLIVHSPQHTVELKKPNMRLDLGGIAPGYAAHDALRIMRSFGINSALVNASGDICVGDAPPDDVAWRIDIAPLEPGGKPTQSVWLTNASITTSGDAFQYLEFEGKRYSHIVDPRTGYGVTQRSSVTVITTMGMIADGLATAVTIMGKTAGMKLIDDTPGAAAYIVAMEDEKVRTYTSSRFGQFASKPRK